MKCRIKPFATRVHVGDRVLMTMPDGHTFLGTVVGQYAKHARHPEKREVICHVTLDVRRGSGLMHTVQESACVRPIDHRCAS